MSTHVNYQTDPVLGTAVFKHLESKGLGISHVQSELDLDERINKITEHLYEALSLLELDMSNPNLVETPKRIAKMWATEFTAGMNPQNFPKMTAVPNDNQHGSGDSFVCIRNIDITSYCSHHLLPFSNFNGLPGATIAYIPGDKVLGISKLPRLLTFFSNNLQLQENLTDQVAEALKFIAETDDVAVYIDSQHTCMSTRGMREKNASTVTLHLSGRFENDPSVRQEFLSMARSKQ